VHNRVQRWHLKLASLVVILTVLILGEHEWVDSLTSFSDNSANGHTSELLLLGVSMVLASVIILGAALRWRPRGRSIAGPRLKIGPAATQQVLIAPAHSVMMAGVSLLLANEPSFGIHAVDPVDGAALVREIRRYRADAIVIDKEVLLFEAGGLYSLLATFPGLRVVVLNPEQNTLQVFDRAQVAIKAVDDLLAVLERTETAAVASHG
jgi:hypothetical protein